MYIEGEIPNVVTSNGGNGNNGWNDWSWIIALALIGGLGNGGFGFGGGFGGRGLGGDFMGWQMGRLATTNDVASGFSTSEIMSDLNDIVLGQAQGFAGVQQTLCQGFNGLQQTVMQGFHWVDNAVCTLGYNTQAGFNAIASQIASCCCDLKTMNLENRYLNEKQTCEIVNASNANTRAILDYLTGEKIAALQAENSGLKAQISNDRQSAYLLNELKPCPVPAYLTCNPNAPYGLGYGVGFGFNTTGSGCCGASVQ